MWSLLIAFMVVAAIFFAVMTYVAGECAKEERDREKRSHFAWLGFGTGAITVILAFTAGWLA